MKLEKLKKMNFLSLAAFTIFSGAVLLTPLSENFDVTNGKKFVSYIIVAMFWGGLVLGIVSVILASKIRKKAGLNVEGKLPGVITFFKNKESVTAFCLFVIGLIAVIVSISIKASAKTVLQIAGLFAALWGFSLHSIFDGLNYRATKNINKNSGKDDKR